MDNDVIIERFLQAVEACGPAEVTHARGDRLVMRGSRRIFASVRPTPAGVRGHLNLLRQVEDRRIVAVEPLTDRVFFHRILLTSPADIDDRFRGWLGEAYDVGNGARGNS